jgi:exonuclease SbcC
MRPLRLELEGFASFRERVCIDFESADLFVLSGPMGAGKSSIIDALLSMVRSPASTTRAWSRR